MQSTPREEGLKEDYSSGNKENVEVKVSPMQVSKPENEKGPNNLMAPSSRRRQSNCQIMNPNCATQPGHRQHTNGLLIKEAWGSRPSTGADVAPADTSMFEDLKQPQQPGLKLVSHASEKPIQMQMPLSDFDLPMPHQTLNERNQQTLIVPSQKQLYGGDQQYPIDLVAPAGLSPRQQHHSMLPNSESHFVDENVSIQGDDAVMSRKAQQQTSSLAFAPVSIGKYQISKQLKLCPDDPGMAVNEQRAACVDKRLYQHHHGRQDYLIEGGQFNQNSNYMLEEYQVMGGMRQNQGSELMIPSQQQQQQRNHPTQQNAYPQRHSEIRPNQNEDTEMEEVDSEQFLMPVAPLGNAPQQRKRNTALFTQIHSTHGAGQENGPVFYVQHPQSGTGQSHLQSVNSLVTLSFDQQKISRKGGNRRSCHRLKQPECVAPESLVTPQPQKIALAQSVPVLQPMAQHGPRGDTGTLSWPIQPSLPKVRQKLICNVSDFKEGQLVAEDRYLEYLNHIHGHMTASEMDFMPEVDFMEHQVHITSGNREEMINWLIQLQVEFKLLPETLFISVNIMDRYLTQNGIFEEHFQLLGITAMLIASKFQEIYPPLMSDFIHMTKYAYTHAQVQDMETKVLTSIEFNVNCTPSQTFLENYARAILISEPRVLTFASFLLDIALLKEEFLQFRTSHITMCALAIALDREQRITKKNYGMKQDYLFEVMRVESYDDNTYESCRKMMNRHREAAKTDKKNLSLVGKYAGTGVVNFSQDVISCFLNQE